MPTGASRTEISVARNVENLLIEYCIGCMLLHVDHIERSSLRATAYEETIQLVHDDETTEQLRFWNVNGL